MDFEEALEYAIDKRKYLINRSADESKQIQREEEEGEAGDTQPTCKLYLNVKYIEIILYKCVYFPYRGFRASVTLLTNYTFMCTPLCTALVQNVPPHTPLCVL